MSDKKTLCQLQLIILLILFTARCAPDEPKATVVPVARVTVTPTVISTTSPNPIPPPRLSTPTTTNPRTTTPTLMAIPTQLPTLVPLPLFPLNPFPTVTPDYRFYETKSIFLSYGSSGGDGGENTDVYFGRGTPELVIYGDGQVLIHDLGFLETTLTPTEMCALRNQIEATGFMNPHDELYTEREESMGAGFWELLVEETYYSFYSADIPYLVEDLARGYELIQNYQLPGTLTPYVPTYLVLWIEEMEPYDDEMPLVWPQELPSLGELWSYRKLSGRNQYEILIEGEWVVPILELFSYQLTLKFFQEGNTTYGIISRPILPHETPERFGYLPSLPRDYVPVLNCEGNPTFIPPTVPTATPTLTSSAASLTGQGRIVFVSGDYDNKEIYLIEANGISRFQLTSNQFADDEPVWSPDGQRIAFVSNRYGNQDIFVMDANGYNVVQLTNHEFNDYSPTWSPDGTKIAFISDRDGGWEISSIFVMNADGSEQVQLTDSNSRELRPVWSPDGRKIAFVQQLENGSQNLVILYLETGATEELITNSATSISRPAWSLDSSEIAVASSRNSQISLINLENGETEQITVPNLEFPNSLDWSTDGRYILFSAREPNYGQNVVHYSEDHSYLGNWNLYALDMSSQEIIQITYNQRDELSPSWWP